jgi:spore coat polysaccharide biosynthesis protein SpsF (cytidylyltransferase family)
MTQDVGIILQARVASTRLPGKALASIGSRTLLEHCLRRLIASGAGRVVLATTRRRDDDALALIADKLDVPVSRGSTEDVLERYAETAAQFGFEYIIRATGDNPCVDIDAPRRLLEAMNAYDADYAAESGLPFGGGVEAMTRDALFRAAASAGDPYEREHVTPFIKRRPDEFHIALVSAPLALRRSGLRLSVDTREDLLFVRDLYARAGSEMPGLVDVIAAADCADQREVA